MSHDAGYLPDTPPTELSPSDQRAVAAELRALLARVESGELDAGGIMVARLARIAADLDALNGKLKRH